MMWGEEQPINAITHARYRQMLSQEWHVPGYDSDVILVDDAVIDYAEAVRRGIENPYTRTTPPYTPPSRSEVWEDRLLMACAIAAVVVIWGTAFWFLWHPHVWC